MNNTVKKTSAVILAAGRGSRMHGLTDEKPKCLLELAHKPLLHWQIESLQQAGIKNILVVRGYKADLLKGDFDTVDNVRWAETNMVQSLLCAFPKIETQNVVISYADIVYKSNHVEKLMQTEGDICISYDLEWQELWQLRAEDTSNDILEDAENFHEKEGKLIRIGSRATSLNDVHGQYMGLLKLTPKGMRIISDFMLTLSKDNADKLDMTSLLSALLEQQIVINTVPVHAGWCECDTEADIKKYEQALASGKWKHYWR